MRPEARKYIYDIQKAAAQLTAFTAAKRFSDYERDAMLRSAVERQFEIVGEALAQLARIDPELVSRFSEHRRIIAFRNILIHGYAQVDDRLVWDIVRTKLPKLLEEVGALLNS
jgi:uncharacterized protein with HEPN domain